MVAISGPLLNIFVVNPLIYEVSQKNAPFFPKSEHFPNALHEITHGKKVAFEFK